VFDVVAQEAVSKFGLASYYEAWLEDYPKTHSKLHEKCQIFMLEFLCTQYIIVPPGPSILDTVLKNIFSETQNLPLTQQPKNNYEIHTGQLLPDELIYLIAVKLIVAWHQKWVDPNQLR